MNVYLTLSTVGLNIRHKKVTIFCLMTSILEKKALINALYDETFCFFGINKYYFIPKIGILLLAKNYLCVFKEPLSQMCFEKRATRILIVYLIRSGS